MGSARSDPEPLGDPLDVGRAGGHVHDELEGRVVTQVRLGAVEVEEHDGGQPAEPLVAVDQRGVRAREWSSAAALSGNVG